MTFLSLTQLGYTQNQAIWIEIGVLSILVQNGFQKSQLPANETRLFCPMILLGYQWRKHLFSRVAGCIDTFDQAHRYYWCEAGIPDLGECIF